MNGSNVNSDKNVISNVQTPVVFAAMDGRFSRVTPRPAGYRVEAHATLLSGARAISAAIAFCGTTASADKEPAAVAGGGRLIDHVLFHCLVRR
jgi:hypothetical protein